MGASAAAALVSGRVLAGGPLVGELLANRSLTLAMLRHAFTQRASFALFTHEWMRSLAGFVRHTLRRRRVLEVCAGRNLLSGPMRALGIQWTATDVCPPPAPPPPLARPSTSDGGGVDASAESANQAAATPLDGVSGALAAVRGRLEGGDGSAADSCDASNCAPSDHSELCVFYSWWSRAEVDEDFLVASECLEHGVPLVLVGEGPGGCTGSSMFWSSVPARPLTELEPAFEDVPRWDGCSDRTWCVLPPALKPPRTSGAGT